MALILAILFAGAGSIWYGNGGVGSKRASNMTASLDSIAKWFLSVGVHPVLGAFLAGAVIAFVFAYRRSPTVELSAEKAAMPSISTDGATRFSSSISGKVSIEGRTVEMSPEIM